MTRVLIAVAISLAAGFAVGAWVAADDTGGTAEPRSSGMPTIDAGASLEERLLSLEQLIAEEREARFALQDQLDELIIEIDRIDTAGPRVLADREARAAEARAQRTRPARRDRSAMMQDYQARRLNTFVDGGFSEDEARRVMELESQAQYRALEAAHEAQRSGEMPDLINITSGPQSFLRSELGDAGYTRYLEAQGQPTAITVNQVMQGSPGSRAGLQPGDEIVSYNGERIFSVSELRQMTMQGTPGEDVIIEVDRDGVRMQLSLQRGPVGITGSGANPRQMSWWSGG